MLKIKLDNEEFSAENLSERAQSMLDRLRRLELEIGEKKNLQAVLLKAKRAYISDLKTEMLSSKAGFDFSD